MRKEDLGRIMAGLSREDRNRLFRRIMYRLRPDPEGKKVVLHEAPGFYSDGFDEEDGGYCEGKWRETKGVGGKLSLLFGL
jgi:hypothetical protein